MRENADQSNSESNTFYAVNRLKNPDIPIYDDFDPIVENMKDPVFKVK